jgi:predicted PurR-regulated permease PerM
MAVSESPIIATVPDPGNSAPARKPQGPRHWALNLVGVAAILGLCYYGEQVLAVMMVSVLLAFLLAPIADLLTFLHLPRALAAALAVLIFIGALGGVVYFSSNQALTFLEDLPKYTAKFREDFVRYSKKAETLQVLNPEHERGVVSVRPATDWGELLTRGFGSVGQAVFAASFIPFLAYFMLSWQQHVRSATVMLFPLRNRNTAYVTLGLISGMIRSFMVGNFLIGLFIGGASTIIFWMLHLPFFYFIGVISGFFSLVPYMGIVLALAPPILVGLGRLESADLVAVVVCVFALHVVAMNVLYPKFLGRRLQLNPLAVTMSLLLWATLWGAVGLLLAIPITAAMKIVFDHVEELKPYGAWLGE